MNLNYGSFATLSRFLMSWKKSRVICTRMDFAITFLYLVRTSTSSTRIAPSWTQKLPNRKWVDCPYACVGWKHSIRFGIAGNQNSVASVTLVEKSLSSNRRKDKLNSKKECSVFPHRATRIKAWQTWSKTLCLCYKRISSTLQKTEAFTSLDPNYQLHIRLQQ